MRELRSSFGRPATFGVLALFVGLFSLLTLWFDDWLLAGSATLRGPLWWLWACLLLVIPAITMRTFVEEHRSGTWSVLGTLPLGPAQVVLGKWSGVMAFVAVCFALTLPWPIALSWLGEAEPGPLLGGYLGVGLAAGALAAVGLAASASTESVVVAFLVPFVAGAVPWLVGRALPLVPFELVWLVEPLSFDHHFDDLARGVLDLRSVAVLLALTGVPLRVAAHLLERRRLC
jgi:ABC-2 type transport system permease protein